MNKKTIIIIIIAILVIIGLGVTIKLGSDYKKEAKIRSEVNSISHFFQDNTELSSLNEIVDRRIISGGQYERIEDVTKVYYKDLYNSLSNLKFLLDEDNFINYLSAKNIKDDGPKFLKSHDNLKNSKAQIEEQYTLFNNLLNDDFTRSKYLDGRNIDIYYRNFYLELTTLVVSAEDQEAVKKEYESALKKIEIYNQAFDFLAAHESSWTINNEVIAIEDAGLREEYNNIIKQLNTETERTVKDEVSTN